MIDMVPPLPARHLPFHLHWSLYCIGFLSRTVRILNRLYISQTQMIPNIAELEIKNPKDVDVICESTSACSVS